MTRVAARRTFHSTFLPHFLLLLARAACPGRKVASVLLALWSPKGGSGTSVFTAACAMVLARDGRELGAAGGVRVADLDGDQAAIFGLGADPELGLVDWLGAGPEAPTEALDRLLMEVAPGIDVERQVLALMDFRPLIASPLGVMRPAVFRGPETPSG